MNNRIRVNGVPLEESHKEPTDSPGPNWELIGETQTTPRGYMIQVGSVRFDGAGHRIRIILRQNGNFVRHMDTTSELCASLVPLIEIAARRGGDLIPLAPADTNDPLWWDRISVDMVKAQAAALTFQQLQSLEKEIKFAVHTTQNDWETSKSFDARRLLNERVLKKKIVTAIRAAAQAAGAGQVVLHSKGKLDRATYDQKLINALGEELRARLGEDVSRDLFTCAKKRFQESPDDGSPQ